MFFENKVIFSQIYTRENHFSLGQYEAEGDLLSSNFLVLQR